MQPVTPRTAVRWPTHSGNPHPHKGILWNQQGNINNLPRENLFTAYLVQSAYFWSFFYSDLSFLTFKFWHKNKAVCLAQPSSCGPKIYICPSVLQRTYPAVYLTGNADTHSSDQKRGRTHKILCFTENTGNPFQFSRFTHGHWRMEGAFLFFAFKDFNLDTTWEQAFLNEAWLTHGVKQIW